MPFTYNPHADLDLASWKVLDEGEQIQLVMDYHHGERDSLPNLRLHAAIHTVVENQVALGDQTPVAGTLLRLMVEGLDRHEAVHAIGSVVAQHLHDLMSGEVVTEDPNLPYYQKLEELTAHSWLESAG